MPENVWNFIALRPDEVELLSSTLRGRRPVPRSWAWGELLLAAKQALDASPGGTVDATTFLQQLIALDDCQAVAVLGAVHRYANEQSAGSDLERMRACGLVRPSAAVA